jgi:hypothetical protein
LTAAAGLAPGGRLGFITRHRHSHLRRSIRRSASLILAAAIGVATTAEPGRWAFDPEPDDFRANALFDLRSLNTPITGFVRASPLWPGKRGVKMVR